MLLNLLMLYYAISIFYIIVALLFRRKGILVQALILVACPFIGLFLVVSMLREKNSPVGRLPDWLLRREKYVDDAIFPINNEDEENIIPFEDALILNDNKIKRKMLLDILKGDFLLNIDALEKALQNEDSETSHYAATAIQSIKRTLLKKMYEMEELLNENSNDQYALETYRDVLKNYIRIEFLDIKTRQKYMNYYSQTLEKLIKNGSSNTIDNFIEKIHVDIELNHFNHALDTTKVLLKHFPTNENAYFASLQVCFQMKNKKEFDQIVKKLKESKTVLSPNKLIQLRFWIQGVY
ncbi:MAG: hypothetical protein K6T88_00260 [Bacillus sp. (in: Bacteria)]|nr:hypothetical protein [Bacillus sp. (in: firmicutes)]